MTVVLNVQLNVGQNLVFGDEHSFSYGSVAIISCPRIY